MPETRYIACDIRKIVLVIATLCEGLRAPPPPPPSENVDNFFFNSSAFRRTVPANLLASLDGETMGISTGGSVFGGNDADFERTKCISRERNIFRGNEIISQNSPHVPLGAPYLRGSVARSLRCENSPVPRVTVGAEYTPKLENEASVGYMSHQGRTQDFRRGVPRSAKQANKPNKRATELKPRTCTHQGSIFRLY